MKMIVEIELEMNGILFVEDVKPEIDEWMQKLKFRHLTSLKLNKLYRSEN